jgi:hypothetical protein
VGPVRTERRPEPLEGQRILEELVVDFVLLGGLAAQRYGNTRMANDVELIPAPGRANLARLAGALRALEARLLNPSQEDLQIEEAMLPPATIWQLATPHGDIDLLHEAPGADPYPELCDRALVIGLGDVRIAVLSRDDLLRMELARRRPR